jgi:polyphosphate glucokinase
VDQLLVVDAGGTNIRSAIVAPTGEMLGPMARSSTRYPMSPHAFVAVIESASDRHGQGRPDAVAMGFPGAVRNGRVLTAAHFSTLAGPGSGVDPTLTANWSGFDLAEQVEAKVGAPCRVLNDADMQALGVSERTGVEVVVTLGTGFGTAVLSDGRLGPHMDLAHLRTPSGETYDVHLGDQARRAVGDTVWNSRVVEALDALFTLFSFDRLYVGGGNAKFLSDSSYDWTLFGEEASILGGARVWADRS